MDKQSFSRYGGIVIVVIILSMMIAFATPFGSFVVNGVKNVLGNFNSTGGNAMDNNYEDITDFPYPGTGSGGNNGGGAGGGSEGSGSGNDDEEHEINEYGFYYDAPYTAGMGVEGFSIVLKEGGTAELYISIPDYDIIGVPYTILMGQDVTATYVYSNGSLAIDLAGETMAFTVSDDGLTLTDTSGEIGNFVCAFEDYHDTYFETTYYDQGNGMPNLTFYSDGSMLSSDGTFDAPAGTLSYSSHKIVLGSEVVYVSMDGKDLWMLGGSGPLFSTKPFVHTCSYTEQDTSDEYLVSEATCTEKAVYYYSCSCGEKGTETFEYGSSLGHTYNQQVATETYLKSAATCTSESVYYYSCSCGAKGSSTFKYDDMLEHTYNQQVTTTTYRKSAATCTSKAVYYYSCVCGKIGTETFEYGDMLAHTYSKKVTTETYLKSAATCTSKAVYYYSCSCGAKGTETFTGDFAHSIVNGYCTTCNKQIAGLYETGSNYNILLKSWDYLIDSGVLSSSGAIISGKTSSLAGDLIISDTITTIAASSYQNCTKLTGVIIPDSVTSIGSYAFEGCTGLTNVEIPDSVTTIGEYAFRNCKALTSITIPKGITTIGQRAFYSCTALGEINFNATTMNNCSVASKIFGLAGQNNGVVVTIGANVTRIPSFLLDCGSNSMNPNVQEIIFEEGSACVTIGTSAFGYCESLESITIPDSVTTIGEDAFHNCASLTTVTFGENSQLTSIGDYAFQRCESLTSITLPDGLTYLGYLAFSACTNLTSVTLLVTTPPTIGTNASALGTVAFTGCSKLQTITVPAGTLQTYKTKWSQYQSKLVEANS